MTTTFNGDTTLGSDTVQTPVTITPAQTVLTYTGPATAVNGQPFTPSATLTPAPGSTTPLTGAMVTFTIGSGPTYCTGIVQADGTVSCTGRAVAETTSSQTVTTSFGPTPWYTQNSTTTPLTVIEPTILTVSPANGEYSDSGQNCSPRSRSPGCLTGTLTDGNTGNPIAGETS